MEVITQYKAYDGKFFDSDTECIAYEKQMRTAEQVLAHVEGRLILDTTAEDIRQILLFAVNLDLTHFK